MDVPKVPRQAVDQLQQVLDSPEVAELIADLEELRWTGRPGYPVRAMVGMCLVKSIYCLPTWSRTVRLVAEHAGLQAVLGCAPSQWACYRFTRTLREHSDALASCLDRVIASLGETLPDLGVNVAIDGSDMPAYASGRNQNHDGTPRRPSDPDASWGHRSAISTRKGGPYYGYKMHAAVDVKHGLPLAWTVQSARESELDFAVELIDAVKARGFEVRTAIMDKGYDTPRTHEDCMSRGVAPIAPLRETPAVKRGDHKPPSCEHGTWTFSGADFKRRRTKWRCPTGICTPASVWIKADRLHPIIPRESKRSKTLYASRGAVEREFGRLKHEWSLLPLRVRGLDRVRLHADLTILARLACRLAAQRALPLAA